MAEEMTRLEQEMAQPFIMGVKPLDLKVDMPQFREAREVRDLFSRVIARRVIDGEELTDVVAVRTFRALDKAIQHAEEEANAEAWMLEEGEDG